MNPKNRALITRSARHGLYGKPASKVKEDRTAAHRANSGDARNK